MIKTLKNRVDEYRLACSTKLMPRVPVIIQVNGRAFSRVTAGMTKPFSHDFTNAMCATMAKLCQEIDGAVFGYTFGDDITIVARNDQTIETQPWFGNDSQKIVSAAASIATSEFINASKVIDLTCQGDVNFTAQAYVVPGIAEAINVLISKQQLSIQTSLSFALYYELYKKYGSEALEMSQNRTVEEKEEILESECGIKYNLYDPIFRRGVSYYRAPTIVSGGIFRNKWVIDSKTPLFTKDHQFLKNIFHSGQDIFRT